MRIAPFAPAALGLALLLCGCGKPPPPPIVEAEGVVLLNGKPLPNAHVEFIPQLTHYGAEMNSTGTTDEQGRFKLTCNQKQQPGAAAAKHKVVITDPPVPKELRGMDEKSQTAAAAFLAKLKNRPIPPEYTSAGQTPLVIEVTENQKSYTLNVTRP